MHCVHCTLLCVQCTIALCTVYYCAVYSVLLRCVHCNILLCTVLSPAWKDQIVVSWRRPAVIVTIARTSLSRQQYFCICVFCICVFNDCVCVFLWLLFKLYTSQRYLQQYLLEIRWVHWVSESTEQHKCALVQLWRSANTVSCAVPGSPPEYRFFPSSTQSTAGAQCEIYTKPSFKINTSKPISMKTNKLRRKR